LSQLTKMIQDVIKGDISVAPTTDMSLINARLSKLEDKVSKMEQKLAQLQAIIDALSKDIPPIVSNDIIPTEPTAGDEVPDMDAVTDADEIPVETDETIDEALIPSQEKEEITEEEITEEIPKINDVKRPTSNEFNDF